MTVEIHRRLATLAADAPHPPDPDVILARVRRRRRRRTLASAGTVGLAVATALTLVGYGWPTGRTEPAKPDLDVLGLPPAVAPPAGEVPVLPTDRGVGRAALAYRACPSCPAFLVLVGGAQYRLDTSPTYASRLNRPARALNVALSPDGRWLGMGIPDGYLVRDLTSTAQRTLALSYVHAWSGNGRWLVGTARSSYPPTDVSGLQVRVDLRDGTIVPVPGFGAGTVVTDVGTVVREVSPGGTPAELDLTTVDPARTETVSQRTVDARPLLGAGEEIWPRVEWVGGAGEIWYETTSAGADRVLVTVFRHPEPTQTPLAPRPGGIRVAAIVSTVDGTLIGRINLPPHAGRPVFAGQLFLAPVQAAGSDRITVVAASLEGGTEALTSLPAQAYFVLRGMAFGVAGPAYPVE